MILTLVISTLLCFLIIFGIIIYRLKKQQQEQKRQEKNQNKFGKNNKNINIVGSGSVTPGDNSKSVEMESQVKDDHDAIEGAASGVNGVSGVSGVSTANTHGGANDELEGERRKSEISR